MHFRNTVLPSSAIRVCNVPSSAPRQARGSSNTAEMLLMWDLVSKGPSVLVARCLSVMPCKRRARLHSQQVRAATKFGPKGSDTGLVGSEKELPHFQPSGFFMLTRGMMSVLSSLFFFCLGSGAVGTQESAIEKTNIGRKHEKHQPFSFS